MSAGGPDGGDGGRGGDVVVVADPHCTSLAEYRDRRRFAAAAGRPGAGGGRCGAAGAEVRLRVPVGTVVRDLEGGEVLADLDHPGAEVTVARGGRGGRGNARFATATRQAPRMAELGEPGERRRIELELKLIADVGLVGLPNAGKSTLLAVLTGARPRIADYPFTTLSPNLGVVELDDGRAVTLADVPGIVAGAHRGAGLGLDFLRHLDRTTALLHVVDAAAGPQAAREAWRTVVEEMQAFRPHLLCRPTLVVLTKIDLPEGRRTAAELGPELEAVSVSGVTKEGLDVLRRRLAGLLPARLSAGGVFLPPASGPAAAVRRYRRRPQRLGDVEVIREPDAFRVRGTVLERAVAMTDLDNQEAVLHLARRLRRAGVEAALVAAGCREGDTVRIGNVEFTWHDVPDVAGPR